MPKASYKKRADNRFRVRYKGKDIYGATQSEAIAKREAYKRQIAQGLREETLGMFFSDYAITWVETYKAHTKKNTYNAYVAIVNRAIDYMGNMRMNDITQTDIQKMFNSLEDSSSSKIKKFCMTINSIFESAVHDRVILQNPCFNARRPKGTNGTHRAITNEERKIICESVGEHDMALAAMIMLYAGLRRGEVLALDSSSIHSGRIFVSKGVRFEGNSPVVGDPKTESGKRSIPIFGPLRNALQGFSGNVLEKKNGEIMSEIAFRRKWDSYLTYLETKVNGCHKRWYGKTKEHKKILSEGGILPPWKEIKIRPHDLRHSFVTMLFEAGVDIKTAKKWAGHANEKMIIEIYTHLSAEREKKSEAQVAALIEKSLLGSESGSNENNNL